MLKYATSRWGGPRPGFGPRPKPPIVVRPDLPRWYVARTGHGAEMTADIEMRLAGFAVFSPSVWRPARAARRDGRAVRPARPAAIEALFPRYLFVNFRRGDEWQRIRGLPGVDSILGTAPDSPIAVPDDVIELLRERCSANGCIYPRAYDPDDLDALAPIEIGAATRLLGGPMADLVGICQMSDARRVQVLLQILGRGVAVTVARALVEAV